MTLFPLHEHQELLMAGLKQSIREKHRRPLAQAPTGSGKLMLWRAALMRAADMRHYLGED